MSKSTGAEVGLFLVWTTWVCLYIVLMLMLATIPGIPEPIPTIATWEVVIVLLLVLAALLSILWPRKKALTR